MDESIFIDIRAERLYMGIVFIPHVGSVDRIGAYFLSRTFTQFNIHKKLMLLLSQDLNGGPPDHRANALTTRPQ